MSNSSYFLKYIISGSKLKLPTQLHTFHPYKIYNKTFGMPACLFAKVVLMFPLCFFFCFILFYKYFYAFIHIVVPPYTEFCLFLFYFFLYDALSNVICRIIKFYKIEAATMLLTSIHITQARLL